MRGEGGSVAGHSASRSAWPPTVRADCVFQVPSVVAGLIVPIIVPQLPPLPAPRNPYRPHGASRRRSLRLVQRNALGKMWDEQKVCVACIIQLVGQPCAACVSVVWSPAAPVLLFSARALATRPPIASAFSGRGRLLCAIRCVAPLMPPAAA